MTMERKIRVIAGALLLASLALAQWVSPWWLLFTVFIGLNLLQSGLSGWCLMEDILRESTGKPEAAGVPPGALRGFQSGLSSVLCAAYERSLHWVGSDRRAPGWWTGPFPCEISEIDSWSYWD